MRTFEHRSRTPHGVRELKLWSLAGRDITSRLTPHGVRELKRDDTSSFRDTGGRAPHGVRELTV